MKNTNTEGFARRARIHLVRDMKLRCSVGFTIILQQLWLMVR